MPISKLSKFKKQLHKDCKKTQKKIRRWFKRYHKRRKKLAKKYHKQLLKNQRHIALVGIFIGIQLMVLGGVYLWYQRSILSFKVAPSVMIASDYRQSQPTQIKINGVGIDLPIAETAIADGIWQIADGQANHLATSARPGEKGNIVIYGHDRRSIFGPLEDVQVGDSVMVVNNDGKEYEYVVGRKQVVSPDDIGVVLPTDEETLTVYTCTGWLDSKRLVLQAYPAT